MNDSKKAMEVGARLFVVSAPSGAGKSTLTRKVIEHCKDVELSISCTTRPPRGDEKNGVDYYFLSVAEFFHREAAGEFLEWAQVHGNYYGTGIREVEKRVEAGFKVIFDIDVQGAAKIRAQYPNATLIFIAPPSRKELERRLRERKTDDPVEIAKRLRNAGGELLQARHYDHFIINDDVEKAAAELTAILNGQPVPAEKREATLTSLLAEFAHDDIGD